MNTLNNGGIVQPYLFFEGRCEEAIEFYKKTLDAEVVMMMRYKDCPVSQPHGTPAGNENKIMHAQVRIGQTVIMMSDNCDGKKRSFEGFSLSLSKSTPAEVDKAFNGLADGGKIQMPLDKTFFSPRFGMVTDRFGVGWMVIVPQQPH